MKKFKINLSVFMVLVIISISILPSFATSVVSTSQAIITDDLMARMDECGDDEKITVYLWYKDIDQNEVDALTTQATGLTREDCEVIDTASHNVAIEKNIDFTKSESEVLRDFIEKTSNQRSEEKERVTRYTNSRREISSEKYRAKSAQLISTLDLKASYVDFESQYAPLIIADMSVEEIEKAQKLGAIEEIGYYEEPEYVECSTSEDTQGESTPLEVSALTVIGADKINEGTALNLTGEGVKVAVIERYRVSFSEEMAGTQLYGKFGIVPENETPDNRYTSNGVLMHDYGNLVIVGNPQKGTVGKNEEGNDVAPHADAVAKTILNVSPDVKLYSTYSNLEYVEGMVEDGVNIFNISVGMSVAETSESYTYTIQERWFDHLVAYHGVTVIKSAANRGHVAEDEVNPENGEVTGYGPRVSSTGLAYNVITVGCYKQLTKEATDDELYVRSSYQNCITDENGTTRYGCEKPDVVMPGDFNGGGTSISAPMLSGVVALMYELKPALSNSPHEVKAIVLASSHRKVNQPVSMGGQETMISGIPGRQVAGTESGITERQGAGAPDAFTMACIVCQGTYGSGEISSASSHINIEQPPYDATNMNVSLTFLKENMPYNDHAETDISNAVANNLDLAVYSGNTLLRESALLYSSTEMCYVPLSSTDFGYKIKIKHNNIGNATRYGYAWSTDNMRAVAEPTMYDEIAEGVYHIKSKVNTRYAMYDTTAVSNTEKAKLGNLASVNTSLLNDEYRWIVNPLGNGYNISTGYGADANYLGVVNGSTQATTLLSTMSANAQDIILAKNDDGTYSLFNPWRNRILSYDSSNKLVWKSYTEDRDIINSEKWYFEKCNYLRGDVDLDGNIRSADATYVQRYLMGFETIDNLERFLADVDRDGYVSAMDATIIQDMSANLA